VVRYPFRAECGDRITAFLAIAQCATRDYIILAQQATVKGVTKIFSKEIFAARLANLRTSKALKLRDVGSAIGITVPSVSKLECGKTSPELDTLMALADFFEVSTDYLLGRSDDPARR
jgi:DNA-binding XRE family transcriptional regulator